MRDACCCAHLREEKVHQEIKAEEHVCDEEQARRCVGLVRRHHHIGVVCGGHEDEHGDERRRERRKVRVVQVGREEVKA